VNGTFSLESKIYEETRIAVGLYCGTDTTCGLVGWMTIVCGDRWTTVIWGPDFKLPPPAPSRVRSGSRS
jgi:hypothetical protein